MRSFRNAAVAGALAAALSACTGEIPSGGAVGETAPEYAAPTLDGDTLALEELRGDVVLINIWATWCPPCREETPDLQALYERYADDGLRILGISIDGAGSRRAIREFADEHSVTYTMLHDPGERVSNVFRVRGVPTSLLIGRDGTIIWRGLGRVRTEDPAFVDMVEQALAQGSGDGAAEGL